MSHFADTKGTILIVDDEPNVLFFLTKIFQPRGYTTLTASCGEEAIKYIKTCNEKIDVMIVDMVMPGLNGVETIKAVKEHTSDCAILVIAESEQWVEECQSLDIEAYIVKPYSLEDLYDTVESILKKQFPPEEEEGYQMPSNVQPSAKVLIVDDEPEVALMIGEALFEDFPESDFRVRDACSGQDALRISQEFQPDIAIIDIRMPEMSGDELIARMKSGEGYCPRDFVIYTGVTDRDSMHRWQNLGHRVLTKPTNIETLHEVLKRICVRHHLLRKKEA